MKFLEDLESELDNSSDSNMESLALAFRSYIGESVLEAQARNSMKFKLGVGLIGAGLVFFLISPMLAMNGDLNSTQRISASIASALVLSLPLLLFGIKMISDGSKTPELAELFKKSKHRDLYSLVFRQKQEVIKTSRAKKMLPGFSKFLDARLEKKKARMLRNLEISIYYALEKKEPEPAKSLAGLEEALGSSTKQIEP